MAKKAPNGHGPLSVDTSVTLTYLDRVSVHCQGCGSFIPKLRGPVPISTYCAGCVEQGVCEGEKVPIGVEVVANRVAYLAISGPNTSKAWAVSMYSRAD